MSVDFRMPDSTRAMPLLVRVERLPGKMTRYQATLPRISVAGYGRGVEAAISALEHQLREFIACHGLGPAADALLPVTHSCLEMLGGLPERVRYVELDWNLADLSRRMSDDEIAAAAERLSWSEFEERIIADVPCAWNIVQARRFNEWLAERDGRTPKPIFMDIRSRAKLLGCHRIDRISIRPGRPGHETWRTLLHELAHHRQRGHRRLFVHELARIYLSFRRWGVSCAGISRAT